MCPEDCCSVETKVSSSGRAPPGGCHSKLVQVLARYLAVVSHLVVPRTCGDKVLIIQPAIKALDQRLDVMHRQSHANGRIKSTVIAAIFAVVADPAQVEITLQYCSLLCLPRIAPAEFIRLALPRSVISRLLRANISDRMRPAAIRTRSQHRLLGVKGIAHISVIPALIITARQHFQFL